MWLILDNETEQWPEKHLIWLSKVGKRLRSNEDDERGTQSKGSEGDRDRYFRFRYRPRPSFRLRPHFQLIAKARWI